MSTLKTNAIIDASGGNTTTINGIPLRQGILDLENRIINGTFSIWQRGTSSTAGGYATADRWIASIGGGTVTTSRQDFPLGYTIGSNNPRYYLRQTVSGQSGSNYAYINQRIEGVSSYAGQTITVLGWARRASGSGDMRVAAQQVFGTGGTPSASVGVADQTVTLSPTAFEPFAVVMTLPSITGKTLGTNNNDYLEILFGFSNGGSFGLQTIAVDLWGIHIKRGTHTATATDLYYAPSEAKELNDSLRYYYRKAVADSTSGSSSTIAAGGYFNTTTSVFAITQFLHPMRTVPTMTYSNLADFDIEPFDEAPSAVSLGSLSTKYEAVIAYTSPTARTQGDSTSLVMDITGAWTAFDAEL